MAYTNIDDPSAHFQTKTYSGNSVDDTAITNDGNSNLQPDFVWFGRRSSATNPILQDSNRGVTKNLESDSTAAEYTATSRIKSFDTDGVTLGTSAGVNGNGYTYVAWQWKANGGTTASNSDGSIATTTQVNSDAGFSIVTWAGGGTGSLGHGLGVVPDMWIVKNRDYAVSWAIGFSDSSILGGTSNYLSLNSTGANATYNNIWGSSPANSSTITMAGDRSVNISGNDYVAYFFKAKQGYSKFGKYVGNGNADGAFIYTGFKPAWVLIKRSDGVTNWRLFDNKRSGFNGDTSQFYPNLSNAEDSAGDQLELLSNGFKNRTVSGDQNGSGSNYIYMAFAENPFTTSTGIPTTAR